MTAIKLVQNYAKALFKSCASANAKDESLQQITQFGQVLQSNAAVTTALCSPITTIADKTQIIAEVLGSFNKHVQQLIMALIENSRVEFFSQIVEEFQRLIYQSNNVKVVQVISASKLSEADCECLVAYLKQTITDEIKLEQELDASLIGGLVIKYDSNLIDCSIKGALHQIKQMIEA